MTKVTPPVGEDDAIPMGMARKVVTKAIIWLATGGFAGALIAGFSAGQWVSRNTAAIATNAVAIKRDSLRIEELRLNGSLPMQGLRRSVDSLTVVIRSLDQSVEELRRTIARTGRAGGGG